MKSTIEFEHGNLLCSYAYGKFCMWFGTKQFGQVPYCMRLNVRLELSKDGCVLRHPTCLCDFPPESNDDYIQIKM